MTPLRRTAGREVTTVDGLPEDLRRRWADAFVAAGASQCGFCTPGIVLRLAALEQRRNAGRPLDEAAIRSALLAHLCRCTGWQTIVEAAGAVLDVPVGPHRPPAAHPGPARDQLLASWRAQLEGPAFQVSSRDTVLGRAGFADDTAPVGAWVAVPGPPAPGAAPAPTPVGEAPAAGAATATPDEARAALEALAAAEGLVAAPSLAAARARSGKVQGRNSSVALGHPVALPPGDWALTLQTTWVEPAYLEPDASWSLPGGRPATPLANGGAFGGKRRSPVPALARHLADAAGHPVRVVWPREEVVRRGPKRPPIALGLRADGTGVLRVGRTPGSHLDGYADRVAAAAPGVVVEEVAVPGPPVATDLRLAGWAEVTAALTVLAAMAAPAGNGATTEPVDGPATRPTDGPATRPTAPTAEVVAPSGGRARVSIEPSGDVTVDVWAGEVLDEVTLRSYCIGAVHQALGWVRHEGIAVDAGGAVCDLTIRSFGILSARDMPWVDVTVHPSDRWPVNGSDAVLVATLAAAWLADAGPDGVPGEWPTRRGREPMQARRAEVDR